MGRLSDLRQSAREYSGSYDIIEDTGRGRRKLKDGRQVSFIRYTNPNNTTNANYIAYQIFGGKDGSFTTHGYNTPTIDLLNYELCN